MTQASKSPLGGSRITARAFSVADRINTSGLERGDVLATATIYWATQTIGAFPDTRGTI